MGFNGVLLRVWVIIPPPLFDARGGLVWGVYRFVGARVRLCAYTRKENCAETSINTGILRLSFWKSRGGITVPPHRSGFRGGLDETFCGIIAFPVE